MSRLSSKHLSKLGGGKGMYAPSNPDSKTYIAPQSESFVESESNSNDMIEMKQINVPARKVGDILYLPVIENEDSSDEEELHVLQKKPSVLDDPQTLAVFNSVFDKMSKRKF